MQEKIYILYHFFLDIQDKVDYIIVGKASFRHSTFDEESVTMREVVPKVSKYILERISVFSLRLLSFHRLRTALLDS
jgi:hypothetical protein